MRSLPEMASALRAFAAQYNTEYVLVALAEPDATAGRLSVTLAGTDAVGEITLKRPYRIDAGDPGYASELAAVVASAHPRGPVEGRQSAGRGWAVGAKRRWRRRRGYGPADRG